MSELRQNPVNKHWVVISKDRAKRPMDFLKKQSHANLTKDSAIDCPFDQGKESQTPGEALAFSDDPARVANTPGWRMRVFPNKYPAMEAGNDFVIQKRGIYSFGVASGFNEIIALSDHEMHLSQFPAEDFQLLLQAQRERVLFYKTKKFIRYTLMFYNHGEPAGGSLKHPHAQFFALPLVSSYVQQELTNEQEYLKEHGSCGHCAMIASEIKEEKRIIMQNKSFVSFAPFASRDPFEMVIYPLSHASRYEDATDDQLKDLAQVLKDSLERIYSKLGDPNFNYYIHTSPHNDGNYDYSHWHLKILPRLTTRGGFELATGIIINVVPPEDAAAFLRGE